MTYGDHAAPTTYHGIEFRSKAEARWALWLDALAVPWEYEPKRFSISERQTYLPDFKLSSLTWLEVKGVTAQLPTWPARPSRLFYMLREMAGAVPPADLLRALRFARQHLLIFALGRSPLPDEHIAVLVSGANYVIGRVTQCPACGEITVGLMGIGVDGQCHRCHAHLAKLNGRVCQADEALKRAVWVKEE